MPEFIAASDHSVLVRFSDRIEPAAMQRVASLARAARGRFRNVHPAYASVLVGFDPMAETHAGVISELERLCAAEPHSPSGRLHTLPVSYDGADLADVARLHAMSAEEVVRLHSAPEYIVQFLGFAPGFPYLAGLDERLATPRLDAPRARVPAGSVAIGGTQTGIYPLALPGGWRLIGRTDAVLFNAAAEPPALLELGDRVRFVPR